jgi:hypothetical protein
MCVGKLHNSLVVSTPALYLGGHVFDYRQGDRHSELGLLLLSLFHHEHAVQLP